MAGKSPTKQIILEAVVTCIEKYGIDKLTTRRIAEEAGTNIASINYHFRSKEELVSETLFMTINHMLEDVYPTIDNQEQSFEQNIEDVFFYLLDGSFRFPGITIAHLYKVIFEKQYDSFSGLAFNNVFERLVERAAREFPQRNIEEIRLHLSQLLSSILFSMLAPNYFSVSSEYQYTSSENARRLAKSYAKIFLDLG